MGCCTSPLIIEGGNVSRNLLWLGGMLDNVPIFGVDHYLPCVNGSLLQWLSVQQLLWNSTLVALRDLRYYTCVSVCPSHSVEVLIR